MTRIGPAIAAALSTACPPVATGITLDGYTCLTGRALIATAALLWGATVSALTTTTLVAALLWGTPVVVLLLDGDTFPFPLLFGRGFGPGVAVDGQVDLAQD